MKLPILQGPHQEPERYDEAMLTNPIVGIAGLKGSGKTELMTRIMLKLEQPHVCLPFAGPLKVIANSMGWDGKKDAKGRRLLQLLGTECGRQCIDQDVWVGLWQDQVGPAVRGGNVVLVDDVRFRNEVEAIKEWGGLLIKIERPSTQKRTWRSFVRAQRAHPSEVPPSDYHFHLLFENDGTVEEIDWFAEFVAKIINRRFPCTPPST